VWGSPIAIVAGGGGGGGGGRGAARPLEEVRVGSRQERARCPKRRQEKQRTGSRHCAARWSRARQLKQILHVALASERKSIKQIDQL
jgi:hypothetical protein